MMSERSIKAYLFIFVIGLAYGALTSLSPVNGIYTSFYTGLVYILFGTSRHLSVGTYAIISLMVLSTINKVEQKYTSAETVSQIYASSDMNSTHFGLLENSTSDMSLTNSNYELKLRISSSLAFWCGIFQVVSCQKRDLLKENRLKISIKQQQKRFSCPS